MTIKTIFFLTNAEYLVLKLKKQRTDVINANNARRLFVNSIITMNGHSNNHKKKRQPLFCILFISTNNTLQTIEKKQPTIPGFNIVPTGELNPLTICSTQRMLSRRANISIMVIVT